MEAHEEYFSRLKSRVEEIRPILQKIVRREAIAQDRIDLEHIMLNPERLQAKGPKMFEMRFVYYMNSVSYPHLLQVDSHNRYNMII